MFKLKQFFKPTPLKDLIEKELDEARRELIEAQTHRDFATSVIRYNEARIKRLNPQGEAV